MKKVLALVLSILVLVAGLPFAAIATDDAAVEELDGKFFSYGDVLYENDFEDTEHQVLPEGWEVGVTAYSWVQSGAPTASAWHDSWAPFKRYLTIGSGAHDGFVSAPEINTRNYVFEADVTVNHDNGSWIGVVNNMAGGVSQSQAAIISKIATNGRTDSHNVLSKQVDGIAGISPANFTLPTANPVNKETFAIKLISFEGKSYLYYNGDLVVSYNNILPENTTDCVGFFGCYSYFNVDNVVITALNVEEEPVYKVGEYEYTVGDVLYENDFEASEHQVLPEGWEVGMPDYVWKGGGSVTAYAYHNTSGDKYFYVGASGTDGMVSSPVINTRNYIFEAEIATSGGYVGVVNNMAGGISASSAAVINRVCPSGSTSYHATFSKQLAGVLGVSEQKFNLPTANPEISEVFKVKIISFEGKSYFYYNGELVSTYVNILAGNTTDCVGFFGCNSWFNVDNVKITAINPVGVDVPDAPKYEVGSEGEADGKLFTYGEPVYKNDFNNEAVNALPEGWEAGVPSYAWNNGGTVDAYVYNLNDNNVITVGVGACDGFVSTPEINTRNYVFEAEIIVNHPTNAVIGIGNNMAGGVSGSDVAVFSKIFTNNREDAHITTSKYADGVAGVADKTFTIPSANPVNNETFKVKLISLDGVTYFYYNDTLVSSYNNLKPKVETDHVNFFGCYSYFHIDNVYITAIDPIKDEKLVNEVDGNYYVKGEELYYTDFEEFAAGALPEGYEVGTPSYAWNGGGSSSATIWQGSDANGRILSIGGQSCDTVVSIPAVNTQNYIYETNIVINCANNASLGLVNDFQGGVSGASGYSYISMRINGHPDPDNYSSKATNGWNKGNYGTFDVANPVNKQVVNLKLISLNDVNYFFVDGEFVVSFPQPVRDFDYDNVGFYGCNAWFNVLDIKLTAIDSVDFAVDNASLRAEDGKANLDVEFVFDKNNKVYNDLTEAGKEFNFGAIIADKNVSGVANLTVDSEGAVNAVLSEYTETEDAINFSYTISDIPREMLSYYYFIRPYVNIGEEYIYCETASYNPVKLANISYLNADEQEKETIEAVFGTTAGYNGATGKSITFGLYADFHYKEGAYISSISNMNAIMKRAYDNNATFVISAGDMTNDMKGSPELVKAFKENEYGLGVYNIYGNHELESAGNTMMIVTPTLTNDENAVWGTEDGTMGMGYIGYYYVDREGFRLVFLDTNYSYNTELEIWEHNKPASWSAPAGNIYGEALGPDQLEWLEEVLTDAAEKDIPCIVTSHNSFSSKIQGPSVDAAAVRKIYNKVNTMQPGTVIMSINGHVHTDTNAFEDGVFYFDTNTTRNLWWQQEQVEHYTDEHTYMLEKYDDEGNLIEIVETPISTLGGAKNSWFSTDPLSAIVTVNENGVVTIDGCESTWIYDMPSENGYAGTVPRISSGTFYDPDAGHLWAEEYTSDETHHWHECVNVYCPCEKAECDAYAEHTFDKKVIGTAFKVEGSATEYYLSCECGAKGTETFEVEFIPGDVDGNGLVNAADLAALKKTIAGLATEGEAKYPDVDNNGAVNAADLATLKKKIAGLE